MELDVLETASTITKRVARGLEAQLLANRQARGKQVVESAISSFGAVQE